VNFRRMEPEMYILLLIPVVKVVDSIKAEPDVVRIQQGH
jgi:hypothetical protein